MVDVKCLETRELVAAALAQVVRMKGVVDTSSIPVNGWESGRVSGTAAYHPVVRDADVSQEFLDSVVAHQAAQERLSSILEEDGSQSMLDWKAWLAPNDLSDLPPTL